MAHKGSLVSDTKPVYKVGFIREKGKATVRELQWSPEAGGWWLTAQVKTGVFMDILTLG
jgi:hypothetical protein